MDDPAGDLVLDGNAVAGLLAELYEREMTAAKGGCASCGHEAPLGALRAYVRAPGIVLRCPACSDVMLRIVQTPRGTLVDMRATGIAPPPASRP
jgi:hypothetical protein